MTETIFEFLSLAHVPSTNMEGAGFVTYTAGNHKGAIQMSWLHSEKAVMSSIHYTVYGMSFSSCMKLF